MSTDRWTDKENFIHTNNSQKREGHPAICDNIDEPGGYRDKWNKPDTERQIPYNLTYMWENLKKKPPKPPKTKPIDTEDRLVVARGVE